MNFCLFLLSIIWNLFWHHLPLNQNQNAGSGPQISGSYRSFIAWWSYDHILQSGPACYCNTKAFVALVFTHLISLCECNIGQLILTSITQWCPSVVNIFASSWIIALFLFFFSNLDGTKEVVLENRGINTSELEPPSFATAREGRETVPHPGREQHHQSISKQMKMNVSCAYCLVCYF